MSKHKKSKRKKSRQSSNKKSTTNVIGLKELLKSPLIRYISVFGLIMVGFYLIWFTDFFKDLIVYPWNNFNAHLSSLILNIFGQGTSTHDMTISNGQVAITIKEGCDAIEPVVLFSAAVLSFPAAWKQKAKGIAKGVIILFSINILRIISLFFIEKLWPVGFEFMHLQFWQVAFIILAVILWVFWMRTTSKEPQTTPCEVSA